MKNSPKLDVEMDWISTATGKTQEFRQQIVAWQMMRSAGNAVISAINAGPPKQTNERARQRHALQLKATLIGYLYEMGPAFSKWRNYLRRKGLVTSQIESAQAGFRLRTRVLGPVLKATRNHAFHFEDMFDPRKTSPSKFVSDYQTIDAIDIVQINRLWKSACSYGDALAKAIKTLT